MSYPSQDPSQMTQQPMQGGQQEHPQAQTIFILSLIGIPVNILAWVAWYMGAKAKKEIETGAPYVWDGNLKNGHLLGKIFGIIHIAVVAIYFVSVGCYVVSKVMGG